MGDVQKFQYVKGFQGNNTGIEVQQGQHGKSPCQTRINFNGIDLGFIFLDHEINAKYAFVSHFEQKISDSGGLIICRYTNRIVPDPSAPRVTAKYAVLHEISTVWQVYQLALQRGDQRAVSCGTGRHTGGWPFHQTMDRDGIEENTVVAAPVEHVLKFLIIPFTPNKKRCHARRPGKYPEAEKPGLIQ